MWGGAFLAVLILAFSCTYPQYAKGISRLMSYFITGMIFMLFRNVRLKNCRIISYLDKNCMGIYILHHIIIWIILSSSLVLKYASMHEFFFPLILFIFSISSSLLISCMIGKTKFKFILGH